MSTTGEKSGKGTYTCTNYLEKVTLDDTSDRYYHVRNAIKQDTNPK
ncbi:hypothetical protein Ga0061065_105177 [Marinomonas fungiae]|uniref:Uncharacterized protein n=1 Tax=Marinomonas fungiae TaxID=1137284 RepID=A0A0K6ILV3_9GAMM|nr:hypothetical protein Ga0061065_105177 [Marinomonas fungiae]